MMKVKNILKIISVAIVFLLAVVSVGLMFSAEKYEVEVKIIENKDKVGVNPTSEKLDFGELAPSGSAIRYVKVKPEKSDLRLFFWKFGEVKNFLEIETSEVLKKGEEERVEFYMKIPASAGIGKTYEGKIWMFKVPNWF